MASPDSQNHPSVAVVIPCGMWHSKFVGEAVASAREADPPPDEIVVVDDFSHPAVMPFQVRGARLIRFQENKGRSHARNVGVSATLAEWIYFLDADDWLMPTAIADFRSIVERNPDLQIVWANYEWATAPTIPHHVCGQKPFCRQLMRSKNMAHIGLFVRRDRFDLIGGFDETMTIGEDRDFFSRYILNPAVRWYKHDRPFVRIRVGGHALPDAGKLYGKAMDRINALFRGGYYDKWVDV